MARQRDVDWSNWKGTVEKQENPLSKPLSPSLKKGADLFRDVDVVTGNLPILADAPKQPNKKEFEAVVAAMLPSEEALKKAESDWENGFNKPIDHLNKSEGSDKVWGQGKSFNSTLSKEELEKRNSHIGEE